MIKQLLINFKMLGQVRVGRIVNQKNPSYKGFENIVVMLKSHSVWYPLSPYFLKDDDGCIMENCWQFSKNICKHIFFNIFVKFIRKYNNQHKNIVVIMIL